LPSAPSAAPGVPIAQTIAAIELILDILASRSAHYIPSLQDNSALFLDRFHRFIREAEMMANFVDQYMPYDDPQRIGIFRPIVQNGTAIEENHRVFAGCGLIARRKIGALEQAEDIEWTFELHLLDHHNIRKVLH